MGRNFQMGSRTLYCIVIPLFLITLAVCFALRCSYVVLRYTQVEGFAASSLPIYILFWIKIRASMDTQSFPLEYSIVRHKNNPVWNEFDVRNQGDPDVLHAAKTLKDEELICDTNSISILPRNDMKMSHCVADLYASCFCFFLANVRSIIVIQTSIWSPIGLLFARIRLKCSP